MPQRQANAFALPRNLLRLDRRTGQSLPPPLLREMESLFGASFGDVRIHTGSEASSIGALAFTHGSSIYFAPGQYNPGTRNGKQLLGHELTHVIQQRQGRARNPFGSGIAVLYDRLMEVEADRMGARAAAPPIPMTAPRAMAARRNVAAQPKMNPRFVPAPPPLVVPRPVAIPPRPPVLSRPAPPVPAAVVQRSSSGSNPLQDFYNRTSEIAQHYRGIVSNRFDQSMQDAGRHFTGVGRDLVKLKVDPNDWFWIRAQKGAYNYGVDVVANNFNLIWNVTKGYSKGVFEKVIPKTFERLDPGNILSILANPELAKRYFQQRKTQIMQPIDFYYDPAGFSKKKYQQYKNTFFNFKDIYFGLDSRRRLAHGGNVAVDMSQQAIAAAMGMWLTMFGMFNLFPGARQNTKNMRDRLFPREKLYGKVMRQLPLRLMFANPISRLMGNPFLAAALFGYTMLASVGRSIRDRNELIEKSPDISRRLSESGTDMYRSGFYLDVYDTTKRLSDQVTRYS